MPKNSTNAAMAEAMRQYLSAHGPYLNFLLVGDCTDICILSLALHLKTGAAEADRGLRVIVPYRPTWSTPTTRRAIRAT